VHKGRLWYRTKDTYARTDRYEVAYEDWKAWGDMDSHHLLAKTGDTAIDLTATPAKPPVLHGNGGIVPKGENRANYYMSYTRMNLSGTLTFEGKKIPVTGLAWFDHEFGHMGSTAITGWDWFSLQMEDSTEYMLYALRLKDGTVDPASHAFRIDAQGREESLPLSDIDITVLARWKSPHNDAVYPSAWRIVAKPWNLDVIVIPTVADQEFRYRDVVYWEGSCGVYGEPANGRAYVELVGYCPWKAMASVLEE
ncbi:MAG: lipocalin family protein, partial [Thermodesulfobacteriota bacterium]